MLFQTVTLAPAGDVTVNTPLATINGGSGSRHAALSDSSDSTYLSAAAGPATGNYGLTFTSFGIDAYGTISQATVKLRCAATTGTVNFTIGILDPVTGQQATVVIPVSSATPGLNGATLSVSALGGVFLTPAVVDRLVVFGTVPNNGRVYEASLSVSYNEAPTVSAITPSTTVATPEPSFAWTYVDQENDVQEGFDLIVYDSATVTALGMGSTPLQTNLALDNKTILSATPSYLSTVIYPNGSYRVYVRAKSGGNHYGPWAHSDFTISAAPPPAPKIEAGTYEPLLGRTPLTVRSLDNVLTDVQAGAEGVVGDYALVNAGATLDTTSTKLWSPPNGPAISTKSLNLTASSAADISAMVPNANSGGVAVVVGELILAGAHIFSTTPRTATAAIRWVDASNATISTTTGATIPTAVGTAPAPVFVVGTAPANAVKACLIITVKSPANAEHHWIDDFFIIHVTAGARNQSSSVYNGNLVSNPSFETYAGSSGAADWNLVTNGAGQTVAVIGTAAYDGSQSLRISKAESSLAPPYGEWPNVGGSVPILPVTAGQIVIVTGHQQVISGSGVTVEAVYNDATHDQVTCGALPGWTPFIAAFQIPSGKTGVSFRFLPVAVGANASQGEVNVDLVNIFIAPSATATAFAGLGGASGTPLGAGLGVGSQTPYTLGVPSVPFFPWSRGGYRPNATLAAQRSIDGGSSWSNVRATAAPGVVSATIYDYEAPLNATTLYRATETSIDPLSSAPVTSVPSGPTLIDPGFEGLRWSGIDPLSPFNQWQPVFGSNVGLTVPSGALLSQAMDIPPWAATVSLRFLARFLNMNQVQVLFAAVGTNQTVAMATIAGGAGDTGWDWYATPDITIPAMATKLQFIFSPGTAVAGGTSMFGVDAVGVILKDAGGLTAAAVTPACGQWLKDPLNPGLNIAINHEIASLSAGNASALGTESTSQEPQIVMQPSDRATPIVISDRPSVELFDGFTFLLKNDAEFAALDDLRQSQRTLLLQLPYGDLYGEQRYIRFGSVRTIGRVQTQDQNLNQRRRIVAQLIEVDAP